VLGGDRPEPGVCTATVLSIIRSWSAPVQATAFRLVSGETAEVAARRLDEEPPVLVKVLAGHGRLPLRCWMQHKEATQRDGEPADVSWGLELRR
jgi:hypothetical protein